MRWAFICVALACAHHAPLAPPNVADNLRVPADQKLALRAHAKGVQIYICKASDDSPGVFSWTLKAPDAELTDDRGEKLGTHYAGPTWQSQDGSKVGGKVRERAPAPSADDVPWLLVQASSNEGAGIFSRVTYVHRVDTHGGKAPTDGCDPSHAGGEVRVSYTATYYFYAPSN